MLPMFCPVYQCAEELRPNERAVLACPAHGELPHDHVAHLPARDRLRIEVGALRLNPGDVVVLTIPGDMFAAHAEAVAEAVRPMWPDVLVLPRGFDARAATPEEVAAVRRQP